MHGKQIQVDFITGMILYVCNVVEVLSARLCDEQVALGGASAAKLLGEEAM